MINKEKLKRYSYMLVDEEKINQSIAIAREKFKEENAALFGLHDANMDELANLKADLVLDGLGEYAETQEKKLTGGLGIQIKTKLAYEADDALKWATEHKMCLGLNKKAFEAVAKTQPLDFVTKEENTLVTFPQTLKLED